MEKRGFMEKIKKQIEEDVKKKSENNLDYFTEIVKITITEQEAYYYVSVEVKEGLKYQSIYAIYDLDGNNLIDFDWNRNKFIKIIDGQNFELFNDGDKSHKYRIQHYHIEDDEDYELKTGLEYNSSIPVSDNPHLRIIERDNKYLYNINTCQTLSFPFTEILEYLAGINFLKEKGKLVGSVTVHSDNNIFSITLVGLIDLTGKLASPLINQDNSDIFYPKEKIITEEDYANLLNEIVAGLNQKEAEPTPEEKLLNKLLPELANNK